MRVSAQQLLVRLSYGTQGFLPVEGWLKVACVRVGAGGIARGRGRAYSGLLPSYTGFSLAEAATSNQEAEGASQTEGGGGSGREGAHG